MAVAKAERNVYVLLAVVLALGVLVFANLLADRAFRRLDLTEEGRYSLSEPFKKVLGRLDNPITLTYYVSDQVPEWFRQTRQDILDRLGEIQLAAGGKIDLRVIDPAKDEKARDELQKEGLEFQVGTMEKDKLTYATLFTSLRLTYLDKPSVLIQVVQRAEDLEYELATKFLELTLNDKPVVAVMAPKAQQNMPMMMPGQRPQRSGFEWVLDREGDRKKYDVKRIEFTESSTIPEKCQLLVLIRPQDLSERARYEVTKYLAEGGRVFALMAPWKVSMEFGWNVAKTPSGLEEWLRDVGLSFGQDFLCDGRSVQLIQITNPFTMEGRPRALPFFVQVLPEDMSATSPLTAKMPSLTLPFPAGITVDEPRLKGKGLTAEVLANTSGQSWMEPYKDTFDPEKVNQQRAGTAPKQPVFVCVTGQFPFPYEGKAAPEWPKSDKPDEPKDETKDEKKDGDKKDDKPAVLNKKPGMLLVWSCPDSFNEMYLREQRLGEVFAGNIAVLENIVERSTLGDDLLQIRRKRFETRPIFKMDKPEEERTRFLVKMAMILGVPLIVLIGGVAYFVLRHARQNRYERQYADTIGPSSFKS